MKKRVIYTLLFLVAGTWLSVAQAQTVAEKNGNIYISQLDGTQKQLTNTGLDRQPVISPDKKYVAFVRHVPGKNLETTTSEYAETTELWLIGIDGKKSQQLIPGKHGKNPKEILAGIQSPQFSPDGNRLYFLSAGWATSGAVHVIDLETKQTRLLSPGNTLHVIQKGRYQGHLIVSMHKYWLGGGSYDWYWLLDPNDGKEIGPIGEDLEEFEKLYIE